MSTKVQSIIYFRKSIAKRDDARMARALRFTSRYQRALTSIVVFYRTAGPADLERILGFLDDPLTAGRFSFVIERKHREEESRALKNPKKVIFYSTRAERESHDRAKETLKLAIVPSSYTFARYNCFSRRSRSAGEITHLAARRDETVVPLRGLDRTHRGKKNAILFHEESRWSGRICIRVDRAWNTIVR